MIIVNLIGEEREKEMADKEYRTIGNETEKSRGKTKRKWTK